MTRIPLFGLLVAGLALGRVQATRAEAKPEDGPPKVVVHVNVSEPGLQGAGLKNASNILNEAPDTHVEAVRHGAGTGLVEKVRTDHAEAIEALIRKGVKFMACENTMRQKSICKENLLTEVSTVPSEAVEIVREQQKDGYAYFKP